MLLHISPMARLIHMEPIHDFSENGGVPSTNETIQDVIQTGREMFAAGERLIRGLDRLRSGGPRGSEWKGQLADHPYVWIAASVGACLLLAAVFRRDE